MGCGALAGMGGPMDAWPLPFACEVIQMAKAAGFVAAGKATEAKTVTTAFDTLKKIKVLPDKACEQIKDMAENSAKLAAMELLSEGAAGALGVGAMAAAAEKAKEMALKAAKMAFEKS